MARPAEQATGQLDPGVAASRRRVEQRLDELRTAMHEDLGVLPRGGSWVLPAVGLALGFSLAVRTWRRRRSRLAG
jgi:hypothetical protein